MSYSNFTLENTETSQVFINIADAKLHGISISTVSDDT